MLKNLYLMSGTDAFTKGGLDNVALTENAVCLSSPAGGMCCTAASPRRKSASRPSGS